MVKREELGAISPLFHNIFYLLLEFHVKTETRFSRQDKQLFVISEVELTRVDCTYDTLLLNKKCVFCGNFMLGKKLLLWIYNIWKNVFSVDILHSEKCVLFLWLFSVKRYLQRQKLFQIIQKYLLYHMYCLLISALSTPQIPPFYNTKWWISWWVCEGGCYRYLNSECIKHLFLWLCLKLQKWFMTFWY